MSYRQFSGSSSITFEQNIADFDELIWQRSKKVNSERPAEYDDWGKKRQKFQHFSCFIFC